MFSVFKKKNIVTDISWLGIDVHSHLLPGLDDGAKNITESVSYIKRLESLGFHKLICTPHIFTELYPNNPETIQASLNNVKKALNVKGIGIEIASGAEYMIDETFEVKSGLLCLSEKYILIEMSYLSEAPDIEQIIFDLQIKGYIVVLAHPERYSFYHKNHERYYRLKDMGCLFQLNLLSILGYYGTDVKRSADYLLGHKLYDLAATDLHNEGHLNLLEKYIRSGQIFKLIGSYYFKNLELF